METPSLDQLRLLYIVHRYTAPGSNGKSKWMKELNLSIMVYRAIQRGLFDGYDWAPSLVECHGVKMYGKVSQEASADLRRLQSAKLIDKLHLSTCLYDTVRAYRATEAASSALRSLGDEARESLRELLLCRGCETLVEAAAFVERANGNGNGAGVSASVSNRSIIYCPACCSVATTPQGRTVRDGGPDTRVPVDFFELADIAYRTRAAEPGDWL